MIRYATVGGRVQLLLLPGIDRSTGLPRRYALVMIPFNAVGHNITQESQIRCLSLCRQHLLPGGLLAFDTFFPSLAIIGTLQNTRVLEGEMPHPSTGLPMRMYDTRSFAVTASDNVRSKRLLDRLGFTRTGTIGDSETTELYRWRSAS